MTRQAMKDLDKNLWSSRMPLATKLRLYNVCISPVFLYGAETWTVNAVGVKRIDALDQWCLRKICGIRWDDFITNEEVRRRTNQMPLSLKVARRRLMLFGHLMRRDENSDTSRILRTEVDKEWKRSRGRPRSTWISTVTNDLNRQGLDVDFPTIVTWRGTVVGGKKLFIVQRLL